MTEQEHQQLEADLSRLRPARPPTEFLERLAESAPAVRPSVKTSEPRRRPETPNWWALFRFRWLAPATALAVLVAGGLLWRSGTPTGRGGIPRLTPLGKPILKADKVEIDQQLVSTFDAVGRLPGGEPVRFRCRQWNDQMVLRDSARGVTVEQRTPRLQVVAVSYDTY